MLDIYAQTFMTATRNRETRVFDAPTVPHEKRLKWFSRRKTRCIDLNNL